MIAARGLRGIHCHGWHSPSGLSPRVCAAGATLSSNWLVL